MVFILYPTINHHFKDGYIAVTPEDDYFIERLYETFCGKPSKLYLTLVDYFDLTYTQSMVIPIITDYFPFDNSTGTASFVNTLYADIKKKTLVYSENEMKKLKNSIVRKLEKSNLRFTENCFRN